MCVRVCAKERQSVRKIFEWLKCDLGLPWLACSKVNISGKTPLRTAVEASIRQTETPKGDDSELEKR